MTDLEKIDKMILMSRGELFYDIGSACAETMFGVDDMKEDEFVSAGESWYLSNIKFIKQKICSHNLVINYSANVSENNRAQIALLVLDVVAQKWTSLPAFSITALILKEGINVFCKEK